MVFSKQLSCALFLCGFFAYLSADAPIARPSQWSGSNGKSGSSSFGSILQGYSASGYPRPSQQYGSPSQSYGPPLQSYGPPSQSYGPPPSQGYGVPQPVPSLPPRQTYGAPSQPSPSYGAPQQGCSSGFGGNVIPYLGGNGGDDFGFDQNFISGGLGGLGGSGGSGGKGYPGNGGYQY